MTLMIVYCNSPLQFRRNFDEWRTISGTRSREEFRCCCCLHGTRESGEHVVIVFRCKAVLERVSSTGWLCDHRDTRLPRYTLCLSKIRIHFARLILPFPSCSLPAT